jgi:hypothetical protein
MVAYRNNAIIELDSSSSFLTEEETEAIKAKLHLRIYEPVIASGEIVIADDGDIVMSWGGLYVA